VCLLKCCISLDFGERVLCLILNQNSLFLEMLNHIEPQLLDGWASGQAFLTEGTSRRDFLPVIVVLDTYSMVQDIL
jgi:hypothetical protein